MIELLLALVQSALGNRIGSVQARRAANKKVRAAIAEALRQFRAQYSERDPEMVHMLLDGSSVPVLEQPGPQEALEGLLLTPIVSDELIYEIGKEILTVSPSLPPERLHNALRDLTSCVREELVKLPELQSIYSLAYQRATSEAVERLAEGLASGESVSQRRRPLHNLPQRTTSSFVGRTDEIAELHRILRPHPLERHFVAVVDGIGGVGKTSLVQQVAYHYVDKHDELDEGHRFDAIIWVSAKRDVLTADGVLPRFAELRGLGDLHRAIGMVMGRPDLAQLRPDEQSQLVRQLLQQERVLLILDNLETVEDESLVAFVREVPDPTKVLVTSRRRIDVAFPVRLEGLDRQEAVQLVADEAAERRLNLKPETVEQITRRTGGVPLGIVWTIGLVAAGHQEEAVVRRLGSGQDDIVRFCFEESFRSLQGSPAIEVLLSASMYEEPVDRLLLGQSSGYGDDDFERDESIATLERLSLLDEDGGRFSMLPLTRSFCQAHLRSETELEPRLRGLWLEALSEVAEPHQAYEFQWKDLRRIRLDGPHIETAYRWARAEGRTDILMYFAAALIDYYDTVGRWDDLLSLGAEVESLALSVNDLGNRLNSVWNRSWVLGQQERLDESFELLRTVEADAVTVGDRIQHLQRLSQHHRWAGDFDRALELCEEAVEMSRAWEDPRSDGLTASAVFELGKIARDQGHWVEARDHFQAASGVFDFESMADLIEDGETGEEVAVPRFNIERALGLLGNLGLVEHRLGNSRAALDPLRQALVYFQEFGSFGNVVTTELRLAAVELELGLPDGPGRLMRSRSGAARLGLAVELREAEHLIRLHELDASHSGVVES